MKHKMPDRMSLSAAKKMIAQWRSRARKGIAAEVKKKGDDYSACDSSWWMAQWASYQRVLRILDKVDKL